MTKAKTKQQAKPKPKIATSKEANKMVHVPKQLLVQPPKSTLPVPIMKQYSSEQLDIIKQTVAKGATDLELAWFLHVAKELSLSPLRKQIHAVKRWSRKDGKEVMTIQTGIDGFRSIADSTGTYAPSERDPVTKYDEKQRLFSVTVYGKKFIRADRSWHEFSATALWDEFVPMEERDGQRQIPFMWTKMPYNQLEKFAEAKMLRRGWPDKFSGVYVHEEMARADAEAGFNQGEPGTGEGAVPVMTREQLEAEKRTRERGTLEPGKEANRGHGDEGFEDSGPKPGTRAIPPDQKKAEIREEQRQAKLETIDTWVEDVKPLMQKLSPAQENENRKLVAQGQPAKYEPKSYFVMKCSGGVTVYAWSKHVFRAVIASMGKDVVWKVSRNKPKTGTKEYLNLEEIISQNGMQFVVDPETKDYVPATSVRTQAPISPDTGECAPATNVANNARPEGMPEGMPTKEELFPTPKPRV